MRVVLIGLGPVGVRFAEELLPAVAAGEVQLTVIGEESHQPYNRVALGEYATAAIDRDALALCDTVDLAAAGVDVRHGRAVTAIDRAERRVRLSRGESVPYDRLVLATGANANYRSSTGSGRADPASSRPG